METETQDETQFLKYARCMECRRDFPDCKCDIGMPAVQLAQYNLLLKERDDAFIAKLTSQEALYIAYCWLNDGFKVPMEEFTEDRKEWVKKAILKAMEEVKR